MWLALAAIPALASEDAVLSTGFRIRVERHEIRGDSMVLFAHNGVTELPAAAVDRFEAIEDAPPPVSPPAPAIVTSTIAVPSAVAVPTALPASPETPADRPSREDPRELLRDAANRSGLPLAFVESVALVESSFRPDAISPKGAVGVMQLMPDTARILEADPSDTAQNIDAGVRLLRDLLVKYEGDVVKALAAYNAGTAAVERYGGLPPYPETQNYVDRVLRTYIRNGGR